MPIGGVCSPIADPGNQEDRKEPRAQVGGRKRSNSSLPQKHIVPAVPRLPPLQSEVDPDKFWKKRLGEREKKASRRHPATGEQRHVCGSKKDGRQTTDNKVATRMGKKRSKKNRRRWDSKSSKAETNYDTLQGKNQKETKGSPSGENGKGKIKRT